MSGNTATAQLYHKMYRNSPKAHRILRITSVTTPHADQKAVGSTECVIGAAWSLVGFLLCPDLLKLIKDILCSSIMPEQLVITRDLLLLPRQHTQTVTHTKHMLNDLGYFIYLRNLLAFSCTVKHA